MRAISSVDPAFLEFLVVVKFIKDRDVMLVSKIQKKTSKKKK